MVRIIRSEMKEPCDEPFRISRQLTLESIHALSSLESSMTGFTEQSFRLPLCNSPFGILRCAASNDSPAGFAVCHAVASAALSSLPAEPRGSLSFLPVVCFPSAAPLE